MYRQGTGSTCAWHFLRENLECHVWRGAQRIAAAPTSEDAILTRRSAGSNPNPPNLAHPSHRTIASPGPCHLPPFLAHHSPRWPNRQTLGRPLPRVPRLDGARLWFPTWSPQDRPHRLARRHHRVHQGIDARRPGLRTPLRVDRLMQACKDAKASRARPASLAKTVRATSTD